MFSPKNPSRLFSISHKLLPHWLLILFTLPFGVRLRGNIIALKSFSSTRGGNGKKFAIKTLESINFQTRLKIRKKSFTIGKVFISLLLCAHASGTQVIKFSDTLLLRNQLIENEARAKSDMLGGSSSLRRVLKENKYVGGDAVSGVG